MLSFGNGGQKGREEHSRCSLWDETGGLGLEEGGRIGDLPGVSVLP